VTRMYWCASLVASRSSAFAWREKAAISEISSKAMAATARGGAGGVTVTADDGRAFFSTPAVRRWWRVAGDDDGDERSRVLRAAVEYG